MCWGRGACPMSRCSDEVVWTNGSHVTVRKHPRYKLKGNILRGNVSLTIENVAQTDRGLYCCRVEHKGWFNDMKRTLSLEISQLRSPVFQGHLGSLPLLLQRQHSRRTSSQKLLHPLPCRQQEPSLLGHGKGAQDSPPVHHCTPAPPMGMAP